MGHWSNDVIHEWGIYRMGSFMKGALGQMGSLTNGVLVEWGIG